MLEKGRKKTKDIKKIKEACGGRRYESYNSLSNSSGPFLRDKYSNITQRYY
jgi:hypothetical protein